MIRIENINKYFNRHKKNEIHVINNVSLEFSKTGLVALLGPSGSGKTTILNTIGGLDKVSSGNIYINNEKITRKKASKIDEIRNLNIGYIFQDYKLVDDMSVYENVALVLKILGIKDDEEIKRRVMYTLEKVNMARYKNRPVTMLSGGERQRVGIARSLVKNPKIILADEPTGNLDSKNSLEIMNIIKSISNKYLVILVTHEEELAKFYADRIIEINDGKIVNDYENKGNKLLNYDIENKIYLKDFNDIKKINKDNINISIYRDNNEDLDINVVFKNGNIYLKCNNDYKLEVVEDNSSIELINDNKKKVKLAEINDNSFEIESVIKSNKYKYSSIFKLGSFISYGFRKLLDYPILKKILLGGFLISGMFIFYSISSIFAALTIKDEDFIMKNKEYLTVVTNNIEVNDFLSYEKMDNINYIFPNESIITFKFIYDKFLQTKDNYSTMQASLSPLSMIKESDLISGVMPKNTNEIIIDKLVIDRFLKDSTSKMAGFSKYSDFLNHNIYLNNLEPFIIVGITDNIEPNVYANESILFDMYTNSINEYGYMMENNYVDYKLLINKEVKLVSGKLPINDYEVILNNELNYENELGKTIDYKINNKKLKVVGYYENIDDNIHEELLVNNNSIKYNIIKNANNFTIYPKDSESVKEYFYNKKLNIYNAYEYSKNMYLKSMKDNIKSTITISSIILGISLLEIVLMIRSSFLSRIKEVGIFRAIGVKKLDIYKMFIGEILAITIISSIPGILFMAYSLSNIAKISILSNMYIVNIYIIILSIIIVLIFNIIVGLLPVFNTIRKTPASILSRNDID